MAGTLFKLVMSGSTTTDLNIDARNFFYRTTADSQQLSGFSIDYSDFLTDANTNATATTWKTPSVSCFVQLFINGILQQTALYQVLATGISIAASTGATIPESGSPIIIKMVNFAPTSSTTVTG